MRTVVGWGGLWVVLFSGCLAGAEGPAVDGCIEDADCRADEFCREGRCVVLGGTGGSGGAGGGGGAGGSGGTPACLADADCASRLCLDDGTCCQQSCTDAACGELRCGRRCHSACVFEFLGGGMADACGPDGWPSGRSATPLASLGGGRFLLFSGDGPPGSVAPPDLWELELQSARNGRVTARWTLLPPPPGGGTPTARYGHLLVPLPASLCRAHGAPDECVLLWGGRTRGVTDPGQAGAWLWARTTGFVALELPLEPAERLYPAVAVDAERERLLLFGGWLCPDSGRTGCDYVPSDDTWLFEATGWRELAPGLRPNARGRSVLTGQLPDGRFLLVGGRGVSSPAEAFQTLWSFDGAEWTSETAVPPLTTVRQLHAAFWAPGAGGLVVHGGMEVTQEGGEGLPFGDTELLALEADAGPVALGASVPTPSAFRSWAWDPGYGLVVFGGQVGTELGCELQRLWVR